MCVACASCQRVPLDVRIVGLRHNRARISVTYTCRSPANPASARSTTTRHRGASSRSAIRRASRQFLEQRLLVVLLLRILDVLPPAEHLDGSVCDEAIVTEHELPRARQDSGGHRRIMKCPGRYSRSASGSPSGAATESAKSLAVIRRREQRAELQWCARTTTAQRSSWRASEQVSRGRDTSVNRTRTRYLTIHAPGRSVVCRWKNQGRRLRPTRTVH